MNKQAMVINALICEVEQKIGRTLKSPKDFEFLQKALPANNQLSMSTLKRLWNYVPSNHQPRESTLSILSQYAGFQDWSDFLHQHTDQSDSDFLGSMVKVADLQAGAEIIVTWTPDRRCILQKTNDGKLQVVAAENCKLNSGDIFTSGWLAVGQPMYATRLVRDGKPLPDYVAGRLHGLTSLVYGNTKPKFETRYE